MANLPRFGKKPVDLTRCVVQNGNRMREVWIPHWECLKDMPVELIEKGELSYWMITEIYFR
jgi:hypothetical protein